VRWSCLRQDLISVAVQHNLVLLVVTTHGLALALLLVAQVFVFPRGLRNALLLLLVRGVVAAVHLLQVRLRLYLKLLLGLLVSLSGGCVVAVVLNHCGR
jgi:hypothetical protein